MIHLPENFDATLLLHDFVKFALPFVAVYGLICAYDFLKTSVNLISDK